MFYNSTVLITGGTGSWGQELTKQLLKKNPKKIIIYSRSELHQVKMIRKFNNPKLFFSIGDVRDLERLIECTKKVDYIFHLAALKHVPICEEQPDEAIKTNINGTKNVIKAAKINNIKKVIDVSTDKAVNPLNLYGMTKAVGERLIIQANLESDYTKFVCIRSGNVVGTNGSVIPYFIEQIKRFKKINLTDNRMTRYFLTLEHAVRLLFKATEKSYGGEIFVMKMLSCKIINIAKVLIKEISNNSMPIQEIGSRPGEKIDEVLVSRYESPNTYQYDENYYVILPQLKIDGLENKYKHLSKVNFEEYSSADKLMSEQEIKEMLKNSKFL